MEKSFHQGYCGVTGVFEAVNVGTGVEVSVGNSGIIVTPGMGV
jgi:hypothetical protein